MRKDFTHWSMYFNPNGLQSWGIGFNYWHEYSSIPFDVIARICQIDLLFFNITITRWEKAQWQ